MRKQVIVLLGMFGCGRGPGSFTGSVQGNTLEVNDALLVGNVEVWLSSAKGLCAKLQKNALPKGAGLVKFQLRPVATGDFAVDPSSSTGKDHTVFVQFLKLNDSCANTLTFGSSFGTKGTLKVERFDSQKGIDGSFDLTFGAQDVAKGTFNATYCDAPTVYPAPDCVAP